MLSSKAYFLKLQQQEQIDTVLKKIAVWSDIALHKIDGLIFKVQSLQLCHQTFSLTFTALNPISGEYFLHFNMEDVNYQIRGVLAVLDGPTYVLTITDFSQELKRRIARLKILEGSSASFLVKQAGGKNLKQETKIKDIHTDGFLFLSEAPLSIKAGDLIQGTIHIKPFDEVQVGGVIRHCLKKDGVVMAGVEIYHLEFGSEEKMAELMTIYKRDTKNSPTS